MHIYYKNQKTSKPFYQAIWGRYEVGKKRRSEKKEREN
jgi:hypothetical protein